MEVIYRIATHADVKELVVLRMEQLLAEGSALDIDISKDLSGYYTSAIADGSFIAWVAEVNGKIVSTCGIAFSKKPPYYQNTSGLIGEVCNVFTEEGHRRKGFASHLLKIIVDEAKARRIGILRVSASKAGEYLYKDFGFIKAENFYTFKL
ncbi:MAG: GNAT family N-acetyltransferase [Bacteroidales bacterium]|jgi:GNAT superfamily N-acetyltransferase|nr:GNAT family N-acetyltransferase [Bacteroidales bacterium]